MYVNAHRYGCRDKRDDHGAVISSVWTMQVAGGDLAVAPTQFAGAPRPLCHPFGMDAVRTETTKASEPVRSAS